MIRTGKKTQAVASGNSLPPSGLSAESCQEEGDERGEEWGEREEWGEGGVVVEGVVGGRGSGGCRDK